MDIKNKSASLIILLSGMLISTSCHYVLFDDPQPIDTGDLNEIPRSFQGTWVMEHDTVIISADAFTEINYFTKKLAMDELEEEDAYLEDGRLIVRGEDGDAIYHADIVGDTVFGWTTVSTTYRLGEEFRLRSIGKEYIVNYKVEDEDVRNGATTWMLLRAYKGEKKSIMVTYMTEDELPMLREFLGEDGDEFDDEDCTIFAKDLDTKGIISYIGMGGFQDTLYHFKKEDRIR